LTALYVRSNYSFLQKAKSSLLSNKKKKIDWIGNVIPSLASSFINNIFSTHKN